MHFIRISLLFVIYLSSGAHFRTGAVNIFSALKPAKQLSSINKGVLFRQREILNDVTNTVLEWEVDPQRNANSTITFTYSTRIANFDENGSVVLLLGLSLTGQVDRSDVVAITLSSNPEVQVADMYGVDNATIVPDRQQNWMLISSQRNDSHLSVTVSRVLNTCDEQDVVINSDLLRIIWGNTQPSTNENGSLTFTPEGSVRAYLIDPVTPPLTNPIWFSPGESAEHSNFRLDELRTGALSIVDLTLQQSTRLSAYFAPYFRDAVSEQYVHHQFLYRCTAPPDMDPATIFEGFVSHPGEECYLEDNPQLPTAFCKEVLVPWAIGGKPFYFPNDIGLPLGESRTEYFMFETHYNNPENRADIVVENGVDLQYTSKLRPVDGSVIFVSHGILGLFQVPPRVPSFTVAGHCSAECTQMMVPSSGMQIEAVILHSHVTGRKISFRHFRGNRELPWIQTEGNYDFNYQQMRVLSPPAMVLQGDQLMVECELDTSTRNATTLSGFSTNDEMCTAFMVLNKRMPHTFCSSEYPVERTMAKFGITNFTWSLQGTDQERIVNAANNPKFVGHTFTRVIDKSVGTWNAQKVRELEWEQLYDDQESACPPLQDVLQLGHSLQYLDNVSKGLIPTRVIVDYFKTTSRSIRTAFIPGVRFVKYPRGSTIYTPPQTCTANVAG